MNDSTEDRQLLLALAEQVRDLTVTAGILKIALGTAISVLNAEQREVIIVALSRIGGVRPDLDLRGIADRELRDLIGYATMPLLMQPSGPRGRRDG